MNSITVKLERFEELCAILSNEITGELRWPIKNLPIDSYIGDTFTIRIGTQKTENEEKYGQMRRLLEELIN